MRPSLFGRRTWIARYHPRVVRAARHCLNPRLRRRVETMDIVQDGYRNILLHRARGGTRPPAPQSMTFDELFGYLVRTIQNAARDLDKFVRAKKRDPANELPIDDAAPLQRDDAGDALDGVDLASLTPLEQEIVRRLRHGESLAAIAASLGQSAREVRMRAHRAYRRLGWRPLD